MHTAGGETVTLEQSSSGGFGRLTIDHRGKTQCAFLTADQLRELARDAEALASVLEAEPPAD